MKAIVVARCALLAPFVEVLNDVGAPAERMLSRFGLPAHPEQKPNDYFPLIPALQFATIAQSSQGITDLGFRAVQRMHFGHMSDQLQAAVRHAPTLFSVLEQWCQLIQIEDNFVRYWLERHDDLLRVCNSISGTAGTLHLEHTQWLQNVMMVYAIRQFAGPNWAPATIAFEARYTPGPETQSRWPHTRFLSGQKVSWIDVPISMLSLPNPVKPAASGPTEREFQRIGTDAITSLKMMLPSYLDKGPRHRRGGGDRRDQREKPSARPRKRRTDLLSLARSGQVRERCRLAAQDGRQDNRCCLCHGLHRPGSLCPCVPPHGGHNAARVSREFAASLMMRESHRSVDRREAPKSARPERTGPRDRH